MARPRIQRSPEDTDGIAAAAIDEQALTKAGEAASWQSQQIALVQQRYDIGMPFNFEAALLRLRECAAIETSGAVEAGLILLHIKASTPGRFHEALEHVGVGARWAQRRMQVATKLKQYPSLRSLGFAKALELLSEDDDTLDVLEHDGAIGELTLDEIDRMSTRELKAALRKERKERSDEEAAHEQIVAKKDERIHKLQREAKRVARSDAREQATELLSQLDAIAVEVATQIKALRDTASAIQAIYAEAGETMDEEVAGRIEQNAQLAADWATALAEELGE